MFYLGETDFRDTPRCLVQNYLLLVFTSILCASIVLKFLSALQLSPKRSLEMQDKFILCQIPCYTGGEDSLRRTVDSLPSLNYDDTQRLLFIICDGNIIGRGNDRTTPRIVLDILGVDPKLDPEPLLFKSIGEGSKQLNYGKMYSGYRDMLFRMPQDSRAMMMNMPMMTGGSQTGGFGMLPAIGGDARPLSMFTMATSVNAFAGPGFNPRPTDENLFNSLRNYLSTQDLMTVTKKTAREAIMAKFPKANLTSRKDFLNDSIDKILSQS